MSAVETVRDNLTATEVPPRDILVLGLGNLLAGDQGVGVQVLNALEKYPVVPGVTLVDGGTGGVHLFQPIANSPTVIVVAATRDGKPAGTVSVLRPAAVHDLPVEVCAVESGLQDLFAAASLLGRFPDVHLLTVSIDDVARVSTALTEPVDAAVPEVARLVNTLAVRLLALKKDLPE